MCVLEVGEVDSMQYPSCKGRSLTTMSDNISFAWGEKGGVSSNKEVRFYKSFQYDEITYNLFDNVYLFKHGDPEPHLGKIVKIWGHANGAKKVKIVWFLHPSEIRKYLGSYRPSENEVFLACGENEALGVTDINPLEAIAGKCCVICASKDERNLQPSQADIERADHIFSRFFDASRCALSDELPSTIASHKIELFLNKKENLTPEAVPPAISNGAAENVLPGPSSPPIWVPSKPNSLKLPDTEARGPREDERNSLKVRIPSIRKEDGRSGSVRTPLGTCEEDTAPPGTSNEGKVTKRVKISHEVVGGSRENQIRKTQVEGSKSQSLPSVKPPLLSRKSGVNGALKPESRPVVATGGLETAKKTEDRAEVPRKRDADGKLKLPVVSTEGLKLGKKAEQQVEEVSRKPVSASDRKKWFIYSGKAWVDMIRIGDEEEKLVLLQNFDASLTASEIEDVIYRATQHICTVRIVTNHTYGDPNYGMAYAIFKNKEAANEVVTKLSKAYLVLPDERPLLCSKGALKIPEQSTSLLGHLALGKSKMKMSGEEMKKAVSTSHCSQPNTIEFDMAVDWIHAQDSFVNASNRLTKKHMKEREQCTAKK